MNIPGVLCWGNYNSTGERPCQVVEERGAARADVGVEGGDGEDAEAVQRLLRRLRHLRQDALRRRIDHFQKLSMFTFRHLESRTVFPEREIQIYIFSFALKPAPRTPDYIITESSDH